MRYIAGNDSVDSAHGDNEFTPFKNIINEWYARDISKKIKSAYRTKALKGEFTGPFPPYGYKKDPNNSRKLILDEDVCDIVKRIFMLASSGVTPFQIASTLRKEEILKPRAKMMNDLGKYASPKFVKYPYDWSHTTIMSILKNQEYLGHIVCNRNTSKSFKNRKLIAVPEDEWIITKNTHKPIIDEDTFEKVQKLISVKKDSRKDLDPQIFIGLLRCDKCSMTIGYARRKDRKGKEHILVLHIVAMEKNIVLCIILLMKICIKSF